MRSAAMKTEDDAMHDCLRQLAQEVWSEISELDPSRSKELLGAFVSELFLSVADQERREMRRQRQAEGIAAAKARGVRFGPQPKPLPDNFDACYQAWQNGQISIRQAAAECGISKSTFSKEIARRAQTEEHPV